MTLASATTHRLLSNTAIPFKSYNDITSNESTFVAGLNILSSSQQLSQRRPGFSDFAETGTPTNFTTAAREYKWSKWGGTRFFSMVSYLSGGTQRVWKMEYGVDANYILLHASTSPNPFDFAVFDDILYYGNGSTQTSMRAWTGTGADRLWGIVKPAAGPGIGTSATGISAFSGYYYRTTYRNSVSGHESSSSPLSVCTAIFTNKEVDVTLVASTDTQVTGIGVYRTTDGGSTDPSRMQEITGSPFANANAVIIDTTPDGSLSTRTCPGTTSNDPPPPCSRFSVIPGRIFGAINATVYFSGAEELNGFSRQAESWPSGITGNSYPFDKEVVATAPMSDGVACFCRGRIWKIEGDRRDNFRRYKLLEKRGAVNHTNVTSLGNSVIWFDTAHQVWLSDEGEIGFDIRTDLANVNPDTASIAVHISKTAHWILLLDGATGRIFTYDLDTKQWMTPWQIQGATSASCLNSGETSSGLSKLTIAYNQNNIIHQNPIDYRDNVSPYLANATTNLFEIHPDQKSEWNGIIDFFAIETDASIVSSVGVLADDDPATGTYTDITANIQDPPQRAQGTNLVKKLYMASPAIAQCERASFSFSWPAVNSNFKLYGLDAGWHPKAEAK
jgi:hypothetical protein